MLSRNIKEARRRAGLSQTALGELVGVKHSTIAGYESGVSRPNPDIVAKLASVFGLGVADLHGSEPPEPTIHAQQVSQQRRNDIDSLMILAKTNSELAKHVIELGKALIKKNVDDTKTNKEPTLVDFFSARKLRPRQNYT